MSGEVATSEQPYRPECYVIAGFYIVVAETPAEQVKGWNRENTLSEVFYDRFQVSLSEAVLRSTISLMSDLQLLTVDDDRYAGRFVSLRKIAFINQFKQAAEHLPKSPLDVVLRTGTSWLEAVYENDELWRELEESIGEEDGEEVGSTAEVPASDRYVTLLHNSPERIEIEESFSELSSVLKTNNEIAVELGDDRERISAEVEAGLVGIKSEKIRVGFIKEGVIRVLRELMSKLKDKAIEIGVDRLIILFEKLVEIFF